MEVRCEPCKTASVEINLRQRREALGLTLEAMAERLPFSVGMISRWESGANNIPSKNLPALAAGYRLRVQDIFSDDGEVPAFLPNAETIEQALRGVLDEIPDDLPDSEWPRSAASALHTRLLQLINDGTSAASVGQKRRRARESAAPPRLPTKPIVQA